MASSFTRFLDHTQRRTTVGRTPLDEWSARRRDLYLTAHNTHNRQTSMPPVGFEPTISAGKRPQTYALDRAATGTGTTYTLLSSIRAFWIVWSWKRPTYRSKHVALLDKENLLSKYSCVLSDTYFVYYIETVYSTTNGVTCTQFLM